MTGFPARWDPATGLGMPPEFFIPSTGGNQARRLHNRQINK